MSSDDLTRASEVFLANSQLCRQILDKEPDATQSLLDIHFEACLKLKELRDACRALATSMPNGEQSDTYDRGRAVGCWYRVRGVGISRKLFSARFLVIKIY